MIAMSVEIPHSMNGAGAGDNLVQQLLDAVGQDDDLLLVQRDGHHAGGVSSLQVERAVSGLAYSARDESTRAIEEEQLARHDCHKA